MSANADEDDGVAVSEDFAALLPRGVAVMETRRFSQASWLWPAERAAVRHASAHRIATFAAGRRCAHRALAQLGLDSQPLLVGPDRTPTWPEDAVGSITHTDGLCAAAVAPRVALWTIGIDAEHVGRVDEGVLHVAATASERARLSALPPALRAEAATVLFSAKEAFLKAQYPLTNSMPDFDGLDVEWDQGVFQVTGITSLSAPDRACGRYAVKDGRVLAAIALPATGPRAHRTGSRS